MTTKTKLILTGAIILAVVFFWWPHGEKGLESTSAWVDGRPLLISARVPAFVEAVPVREGQMVKAGQLLFKQDDSALRVTLAEERGQATLLAQGLSPEALSEAAQISEPGAEDLPAQLADALLEETDARRALEQYSTQEAKSAVTLARFRMQTPATAEQKASLEEAVQANKAAKIRLEGARETGEKASKQRAYLERKIRERKEAGALAVRQGGPSEEIRARKYQIQLARVTLAEKNLSAATVSSPADGYITKLNIKAGEVLPYGAPALELTPVSPDQLWVMALYPKDQAQKILLGQRAEVLLPELDGKTLPGIVTGKGLPGDAVNAPVEERVKDAVPVRLAIKMENSEAPVLKPGLKARVSIFTETSAKNTLPEQNATIPPAKKE